MSRVYSLPELQAFYKFLDQIQIDFLAIDYLVVGFSLPRPDAVGIYSMWKDLTV